MYTCTLQNIKKQIMCIHVGLQTNLIEGFNVKSKFRNKKEDKLNWFELILKTLSAIGSEGKTLSKGTHLWTHEACSVPKRIIWSPLKQGLCIIPQCIGKCSHFKAEK